MKYSDFFLCVLGISSSVCLSYFIFMDMHTPNGSVFPATYHQFVLSIKFSKTFLRAGSDLSALSCPQWHVGTGRWVKDAQQCSAGFWDHYLCN